MSLASPPVTAGQPRAAGPPTQGRIMVGEVGLYIKPGGEDRGPWSY